MSALTPRPSGRRPSGRCRERTPITSSATIATCAGLLLAAVYLLIEVLAAIADDESLLDARVT
ncbi:hypothetical protein SAMN04489810_2424 [Microbacterium pygmaeum]|uniref:Uncharacterized protein n=1 Tax=Microbacterium pygmaeum TaxID=370764 RepID=A0A1G8AME8_9MICO|nr:hypothetical protein SAMN04489810_2424 [Microbacterium pygmaeum]